MWGMGTTLSIGDQYCTHVDGDRRWWQLWEFRSYGMESDYWTIENKNYLVAETVNSRLNVCTEFHHWNGIKGKKVYIQMLFLPRMCEESVCIDCIMWFERNANWSMMLFRKVVSVDLDKFKRPGWKID